MIGMPVLCGVVVLCVGVLEVCGGGVGVWW